SLRPCGSIGCKDAPAQHGPHPREAYIPQDDESARWAKSTPPNTCVLLLLQRRKTGCPLSTHLRHRLLLNHCGDFEKRRQPPRRCPLSATRPVLGATCRPS